MTNASPRAGKVKQVMLLPCVDTLDPYTTPAPRPSSRLRRGRSKARAPVARKPCLIALTAEGLTQAAVP